MYRLCAILCLLGGIGALWLDSHESGKVIEGYPLLAALAILGAVVCLALHIYGDKNTIPETGKEFVDNFLASFGVKGLAEARRLVGGAVRSDADAKESREQAKKAEASRKAMQKERDKAERERKATQDKLDRANLQLDALQAAEKERLRLAQDQKAEEATARQQLPLLQEQLRTASETVARLTGEVTEKKRLADTIPGLESAREAAVQQKLAAERERDAGLARELTLNGRIAELEAEVGRLNDRLTAAAATPIADPAEVTRLRAELERAATALQEARVASTRATQEAEELRRWKTKSEPTVQEVDTLRSEVVGLRNANGALERWKSEAEPRLALLLELQPKHAQLLISLGAAERARDAAIAKEADARSGLAASELQHGTTRKELGKAQARVTELEQLRATKQQEFDTALAKVQQALTEALAEIERLRLDPPGLAAANAEIKRLEAQVRELTELGTTLQAKIDEQTAAIANAATERQQFEALLAEKEGDALLAAAQLARIPELEKKAAGAAALSTELELLKMGDRELAGTTLQELRAARDEAARAIDFDELALKQLNFAVVFAMAMNPGPELKALGVTTRELSDYAARTWDEATGLNPDRVRSELFKRGKIPTAAWNHHIRMKKNRERMVATKVGSQVATS